MLDVVLDLTLVVPALVGAVRVAPSLVLALGGTPPRVPGAGEDEQAFDPNDVTPGTVGFIATFAMVVVVVFLIRDMSRRVRRINLQGRAEEDTAREAAPDQGSSLQEGAVSDDRASGDVPGPRAVGGARPSAPPRGLRSIRPPVRGDEPVDGSRAAARRPSPQAPDEPPTTRPDRPGRGPEGSSPSA